MNLQIRLATSNDIPQLEELIRAAVSGLSTDYYTPEQIQSGLTYVFGVDTQLIVDGTYFVAEVDHQLVASGGWSKRRTLFGGDQTKSGAEDPLLNVATEAARIRAFYVNPNWSRKGIASQILRACEEAARAAGFSRIELAATLPGEPLYSARGYLKGETMMITTADGGSLPVFRMSKTLNS